MTMPAPPVPVVSRCMRRITGEHAPDGWYAVAGEDPGWPDVADAASLLAAITRLVAHG